MQKSLLFCSILFLVISCAPIPIPRCDGHILRGDKYCFCLVSAKELGQLARLDTLDVPLRKCEDE